MGRGGGSVAGWRRDDGALPVAHLEEAVVLAQVDRLLPAVVALVEERGDAAELDQLVLLEELRQRDVVEVVERLDRGAHRRVVLLVNQQVVEGLVDRLVVVVLQRATDNDDNGKQLVYLR